MTDFCSAWANLDVARRNCTGVHFLGFGQRQVSTNIEGRIGIAHRLGASEALIGMTVVAVATSLPEMAFCFAAAIRRQSGMLLRDLMGSNAFNRTIVRGAAAMVEPIAVADEFIAFWIPVAIAASVASLIFLRTGFFLSHREVMPLLVGYAAIFEV